MAPVVSDLSRQVYIREEKILSPARIIRISFPMSIMISPASALTNNEMTSNKSWNVKFVKSWKVKFEQKDSIAAEKIKSIGGKHTDRSCQQPVDISRKENKHNLALSCLFVSDSVPISNPFKSLEYHSIS